MMMNKARAGLSVGAVAAVWFTTAALVAPQPVVEPVADCEVTVGVERVPVQAEPVQVPLRHTAALGDSIAATLPAESGARVEAVSRGAEDEPNTLSLVLNTSAAVAGEWPLTVGDGETECRGTLTIGAADGDGR